MNEDTVKVKDFWWTFILPLICAFGFFTNLINIVVFLKLKSKNPIYKLMLSNSITNFFYSLICFFVFIMRCGQYCTIQNTYWVKVYEKYLFYYLTSALGLFNIFIEVCVAIQRYLIVANKNLPKKLPIKIIILVLFILSLVLYTPNMFYRQIVLVQNDNLTSAYIIQTSKDQYVAKCILTVISGMRGLLILFLLLIINLLLLHRFKYQVEKKNHIKSIHLNSNNNNNHNKNKHDDQYLMPPEHTFTRAVSTKSLRSSGKGNENDLRAKKNMTRMVIWMSIFFFIGNLLNSLSFYILEFTQNSFVFITYYVLVSNSLLFTSHGINIFFYYFFNKNYRNIFKDNHIFKLFK